MERKKVRIPIILSSPSYSTMLLIIILLPILGFLLITYDFSDEQSIQAGVSTLLSLLIYFLSLELKFGGFNPVFKTLDCLPHFCLSNVLPLLSALSSFEIVYVRFKLYNLYKNQYCFTLN